MAPTLTSPRRASRWRSVSTRAVPAPRSSAPCCVRCGSCSASSVAVLLAHRLDQMLGAQRFSASATSAWLCAAAHLRRAAPAASRARAARCARDRGAGASRAPCAAVDDRRLERRRALDLLAPRGALARRDGGLQIGALALASRSRSVGDAQRARARRSRRAARAARSTAAAAASWRSRRSATRTLMAVTSAFNVSTVAQRRVVALAARRAARLLERLCARRSARPARISMRCSSAMRSRFLGRSAVDLEAHDVAADSSHCGRSPSRRSMSFSAATIAAVSACASWSSACSAASRCRQLELDALAPRARALRQAFLVDGDLRGAARSISRRRDRISSSIGRSLPPVMTPLASMTSPSGVTMVTWTPFLRHSAERRSRDPARARLRRAASRRRGDTARRPAPGRAAVGCAVQRAAPAVGIDRDRARRQRNEAAAARVLAGAARRPRRRRRPRWRTITYCRRSPSTAATARSYSCGTSITSATTPSTPSACCSHA